MFIHFNKNVIDDIKTKIQNTTVSSILINVKLRSNEQRNGNMAISHVPKIQNLFPTIVSKFQGDAMF